MLPVHSLATELYILYSVQMGLAALPPKRDEFVEQELVQP